MTKYKKYFFCFKHAEQKIKPMFPNISNNIHIKTPQFCG